jgi:hypothetical protein
MKMPALFDLTDRVAVVTGGNVESVAALHSDWRKPGLPSRSLDETTKRTDTCSPN